MRERLRRMIGAIFIGTRKRQFQSTCRAQEGVWYQLIVLWILTMLGTRSHDGPRLAFSYLLTGPQLYGIVKDRIRWKRVPLAASL